MSDLSGKIVTGRRPQEVDRVSVYNERVNQLSQAATVPVDIQVSAKQIDQYDAVSFQANSSETLVSFLWDFGDGVTSQEANPTHVFGGGQGSSYTVSVVVTDAQGRVGLATAENVISVQNDSYLFEKLTNPVMPWSLFCKHSNAYAPVRIRETNNSNEMNLGFASNNPNDIVDEAAFNSFLNNNNATEAAIVAGYSQIDGTKLFEETDGSKQAYLRFMDINGVRTPYLIQLNTGVAYALTNTYDFISNAISKVYVSGLGKSQTPEKSGESLSSVTNLDEASQIMYAGDRSYGIAAGDALMVRKSNLSLAGTTEDVVINAFQLICGGNFNPAKLIFNSSLFIGGKVFTNSTTGLYSSVYTHILNEPQNGNRGIAITTIVYAENSSDAQDRHRYNLDLKNQNKVNIY